MLEYKMFLKVLFLLTLTTTVLSFSSNKTIKGLQTGKFIVIKVISSSNRPINNPVIYSCGSSPLLFHKYPSLQ